MISVTERAAPRFTAGPRFPSPLSGASRGSPFRGASRKSDLGREAGNGFLPGDSPRVLGTGGTGGTGLTRKLRSLLPVTRILSVMTQQGIASPARPPGQASLTLLAMTRFV
jgi:hypothetical protein